MRKVFYSILAIFVLVAPFAYGDVFNDYNTYPNIEISYQGDGDNAVSVTDTATTLTFSKDSKAIWIDNEGANEVYVNLFGNTATTSDFKINAGENRGYGGFQTRSISLVCDTGESTTVNVEVIY